MPTVKKRLQDVANRVDLINSNPDRTRKELAACVGELISIVEVMAMPTPRKKTAKKT